MDFQRFSAKTVNDAITAACQRFVVTSDRLEYEVLEEGSTGFLGFNAKPAVIQARVKATTEDKARDFLNDVFAAMNMTVLVEVAYDEENRLMDIELKGDDMGVLIGKRGQTLDSLQYLVSLVVNKDEEEYIRVKVDTENYRKRRKETLENLAKNIAYKVKRTKRPVSLEPMNPYERRIIHSMLQNDKYVTTHSEGEEPFRHVVVTLKRF
ncbi:MAG: RNA-binding cell elongation regulator Jag/EloR [Eubacteriales bacterium]|nr:RNA-binding cell elongation regulator Jag/EloR [Eubacteriales bacterium]